MNEETIQEKPIRIKKRKEKTFLRTLKKKWRKNKKFILTFGTFVIVFTLVAYFVYTAIQNTEMENARKKQEKLENRYR